MKKALLIALAAAAMTGATSVASAAPVTFSGTMIVEQTTAACGILPYIEQGTLFKISVRPANLGTNGPSTTILLTKEAKATFNDLIVSSFTLANGTLTNTFQSFAARKATPGADLSLTFEQFTSQMRYTAQAPLSLDASSPYLIERLQIARFANVPACIVTGWVATTRETTAP